MNIETINEGDYVVYIPHYLLMGTKSEMIKDENLGIVTSKNDMYVFVRYKDKTGSQATRAEDLYTLRNRPDLIEKLTDVPNDERSVATKMLREQKLVK